MRQPSTPVEALLPAWRAAEFIQPTLASLSAQTHDNFTVSVSVDQCDDETYDICVRHACSDPRFHVVRQDSRLGYAGNCNFLLGQATADYVLFAFHDDVLAPTCLEKLAAALDAAPDAVLSYSDVDLTDVDGAREHWELPSMEGASRVERGHHILMGGVKWWVPNRGIFRRAPALTIGGIKTHEMGEFAADWPWIFRLSLLGDFVRVPETLCFKFYKPGSLTKSWDYSREQYFAVGCACMRELWNADLTDQEKMQIAVPLTKRLISLYPQPADAQPSPAGAVGSAPGGENGLK